MLQAEEDRDQVRRYWAEQERERQLMGTNTKVYNSDRFVLLWFMGKAKHADTVVRFVRPTFAVTPAEVTK